MFSAIRLRNLRSFSDSKKVSLRPLTLLVGPNNAGKSTVLNSILLLAQSVQGTSGNDPLSTGGPIVDLGSFDDIVRGGPEAKKPHFSIDLELSQAHVAKELKAYGKAPKRKPAVGDHLAVTFSFNRKEDRIEIDRSDYYQDEKLVFGLARKGTPDGDPSNFRIRGRLPVAKDHVMPAFSSFMPQIKTGELLEQSDPRFVDALTAQLDSMIRTQVWTQALNKVELVAPLRDPIPRFTFLGRTAAVPAGVASGGEGVLQLLRTADKVRKSGQGRIVDLVDYWLSKKFQLTRDLRIVDVDRAARVLSLVADQKGGFAGINIANMGEGVSQLLPIVASIVMLEENHTVLVEQPEIHLHPAAQADLGDLMIAGLDKEGSRQVIVETHSEHLLLRVRRRIAEGKLNPEEVAVLYVEKPGSASKVRQLSLDEQGNFDDWPAGFFDEAYQEALQLSLAGASE